MMENMLLAFESLKSNKMRTFLTMLGIIIGIASVIAIMALGNVMTNLVSDQMSSMGVNNVFVSLREKGTQDDIRDQRVAMGMSRVGGNPSEEDKLSPDEIAAMYEAFSDEIEAVSLSQSRGSAQIKDGIAYANVSIVGVNPDYFKVNTNTLLKGRLISDADVSSNRNVCLISDNAAKRMFGDGDPIGQEVSVYMPNAIKQYTVIGMYRYEEDMMTAMSGMMSAGEVESNLFIPVTVAKKDAGSDNYTNITIMAAQNVDVAALTDKLEAYFTRVYRLNSKYEAHAFNLASQVEMAMSMMSTISLAIAVIAGISLIVGGIGVMNIMLVSVTERTHEIGIRKALGARDSQIRMQFVTEAMMVSCIGGVIGIILGLLMGSVGALLLGGAIGFSIPTVLGTVFFSMLIGVFFGYYPANKAAMLNPIDALRYE